MEKPDVILNAAMTVDGKISSVSDDSDISCSRDLDRVHEIRDEVDAIMVGVGTVLADDPKLTVRRVEGENPLRIVVDSEGRTPLDADVLDGSAPSLMAVSQDISDARVEELDSKGVEVLTLGEGQVDLAELLAELKERGIETILLEGGSKLNWGMFQGGLVDEVRLFVKSCVLGGSGAKSLVEGIGFKEVSEGVSLELLRTRRIGDGVLLSYRVIDDD